MGLLPTEYYTELGHATAAWAMLELGIDFTVAVTFNGLGGDPKHPEIPTSLSHKIRYLRDVCKRPRIAPWRGQITELADEIDELKEKRHTAIHGVALKRLAEGEFELSRVRSDKLIHRTELHPVSIDDLKRLSWDSFRVTVKVMHLVEELVAAVGPDGHPVQV